MNLIQSFFYGGILLASINYVSNKLKNPALASIIAAIPIGLMSLYLLKEGNICNCFSRNYIVTGIVHITASIILYILLINFKFRKNYAVTISVLIWFSLQYGRYLFLKKYYPEFLYP
tara:strand:- start:471 stop:821 length:351 start_codon:yes stop_codon:yes gene_type:complete